MPHQKINNASTAKHRLSKISDLSRSVDFGVLKQNNCDFSNILIAKTQQPMYKLPRNERFIDYLQSQNYTSKLGFKRSHSLADKIFKKRKNNLEHKAKIKKRSKAEISKK
mmetsp:Transcript_1691/g.1859  ORF Transcript_1691/g.1859 Transcript_1691/m.1859 type:complete len:110 (+) Transcript_1691:187-516(+)